jgi:hypothetical protein
MEHHEALNRLKDTEDALFRACEKVVGLEQALAEKDKRIEELKEHNSAQAVRKAELHEEIERLKKERADLARRVLKYRAGHTRDCDSYQYFPASGAYGQCTCGWFQYYVELEQLAGDNKPVESFFSGHGMEVAKGGEDDISML